MLGRVVRAGRLARALVAAAAVLAAAPAPRAARAQSSPWTAVLSVQPFPSPFVADWERNPQTAVLTLFYGGTAPQDVHVEGFVRSAERGELARVQSPPISLPGGPVTQVFTAADVLEWQTVSRNQQYADMVLRTGRMPEGALQMCATVLSAGKVPLAQACADFEISLPDPPQLLYPTNGGTSLGLQPVFQWTPVLLPPSVGVSYRLRIVEFNAQQTPQTAMVANPTWFELETTGAPLLTYPLDALPLDPQKQYAWQVEVLDGDGRPVTRGGRASEIWTFSVGGPSREDPLSTGLPDTLTLIPGLARLIGVRSVQATTTAFSYVLDGALTLELDSPVRTRVRVEADGLELDRATLLTAPQVRGGRLTGDLGAGDSLSRAAGPYARLTRVVFAPGSGLALEGTLTPPGATAVPLSGQLQLTTAGPFGELVADAGAGSPLFSVGSDPARLAVRRVRVRLPEGTIAVDGGLELFAHDLGCDQVSGTLAADGTFQASVACTPSAPLPITAAGDRTQVTLRSVTGTLSANVGTGAVSYRLTASGELRLDAGFPGSAGAGCGASLAIALENGALTVPSFAPHCDAADGEAHLGWLRARLSSLALDHLTYAAGKGFDFALKVSLAPWAPDLPGLELPALDTVVITQAGLAIPAVDVAVNRPPVPLGGFALRVTRVRLPAFTLSWADWQLGSPNGFAFSLDGEVSLPELPAGVGSCLAAQPIAVTGVELSGGRLKAHIEERRFTPPCTLALKAPTGGAASGDSTGTTSGEGPLGLVQEPVRPPADAASAASPQPSPMAGAITGESPKDNPFALQASELAELQRHDQDRQRRLADPQCDAICVRHVFDEEQSEREGAWTRWHERAFGDLERKQGACLSPERQTALAGTSAQPMDPTCERLVQNGTDSVLAQSIATLASVPPKPSPCDLLCQRQWLTQKDCRNELDFVSEEHLKVWAAHVRSGTTEEAATAAGMQDAGSYCLQQAQLRYEDACTAKASPAQLQYQMTAYVRERDRFQTAGDGSELPWPVGACAPPALPKTGSGSAALPGTAPPETLALGPPPPSDGEIHSGPHAVVTDAAPEFGGAIASVAPGVPGARAISGARLEASSDAGGVRLELERFGGDLVVSFYPQIAVVSVPEIEGNVVLPPLFQCADKTAEKQPLLTKLRLGPHGEVDGTISGFVPGCPVNLAAVRVQAKNTSLTFSTAAGHQAVVLTGTVTASFTAASQPVTAEGEIAVDVLAGRVIGGSLTFKGPLQIGLPRDAPVVSFTLASASLDTLGIHVDGRARLVLADSQGVAVTFDRVTINPATLRLSSGRVLFDAPFGFEVGIAADGTLGWRAVARGAALTVQSGLHVDLPSQAVLDSAGLRVSGDGGAHLVFGGRDVDSVTASFSQDFSFGLAPPAVVTGRMDLRLGGQSVAYVDALGFHPNLAAFASAAIPARLGLPNESVAYLELRDPAGKLRVSTENSGKGVRLFTPAGITVPLVVPALQRGRPAPPQVGVGFDITLDPLGQGVSAGSVTVALSPADQAAFDLSPLGIPLTVDTLAFDRGTGGAYRLAVGGALALFGQHQGGAGTGKVLLTIDGSGQLTGDVNLTLAQSVSLVPGSDKLVLDLESISGSFNASLASGQLAYTLDVTGGLELALSATERYRANATLEVSERGVTAKQVSYVGSDEPKYIELPGFRLGLNNLRVPTLAYSDTGGFRFEILFDATLGFPSLQNLTLPPIKDIALRNDGFAIPAYEVPQLDAVLAAATGGTSDPLSVAGLEIKPLAFRMGAISYNWFTGKGPADWGFGFDLELSLANLSTEAPAELRDMKLRVLDAGLRDGRLHGTIEKVDFPDPPDIGIGNLLAVWGRLPEPRAATATAAASPDTAPMLSFEVNLHLAPHLPFCDATVTATHDTVSIYADGWVAGRVQDLVANCSAQLGPIAFRLGASTLDFAVQALPLGSGAARTRHLELEVSATASVSGTAGDTVTGQGTLKVDVLGGKLLDGRIEITKPFRWTPPGGSPFLAFDVDRAAIDAAGLHFTGGGRLRLADGATVDVTFNDLVLGIPDLGLKSGSVQFQNSFAVGVRIGGDGALSWGVYSLSAARPSGNALRVVLPQSLTLDASGLKASGTAAASLVFNGQEFATAQVTFADGFAVGVHPVAVTAGRADFIVNDQTIATLGPDGFKPGNVFAVLPIPAHLGLPTESVAYLELKDANGVTLIESASESGGLRLKTKAGAAVRLVVPALAKAGGAAPAVDVAFDVLVNPATLHLVSGSIEAKAAAGAPALFSLHDAGLPLEIRSVAYGPVGSSYALRVGGRLELPASLSSADLVLSDLTVTAQGLSGTADLGTYKDAYDAQVQPFKTLGVGQSLSIEFTGVHAVFGAAPAFKLAGVLRSPVFAPQGGTAVPLFFTAQLTAAGLALSVDPAQSAPAALPLAIATFAPQGLGGQAAIQVRATASEFAVRLSGVLRVPSLSAGLAVTVDGLEIGTAGVKVPTISIAGGADAQQFTLFGAAFTLQDSVAGGAVVYPAVAGGFAQGVLTLTLSGSVRFLENTTRFYGLSVSSTGAVGLAAANLISAPVAIVQGAVTLDTLAIRNNALHADLAVILPAPLDAPGAQHVGFTVGADGTVSGGGHVVVVNEPQGVTGTSPFRFSLGVATVHVRYISLDLDLSALKQNSAVNVVTDLYLQNDANNLIQLGDVASGAVQPGLRVGFDGSVRWANAKLARTFTFDVEAVRLKITQVAMPPQAAGFGVALSGELSLNLPSVMGALAFEDFAVTSRGHVEFSPSGVKGGNLSVADVVTMAVSGFQYSTTETTLQVHKGGIPAAGQPSDPGTESITVESFVRFGGTVSVAGAFSGGVQEFIAYRTTDQRSHLVIRDASLEIPNVLTMHADLRYDENPNGFEMLVGAQGTLSYGNVGVVLVGALGLDAPATATNTARTRLGVFIATRGLDIWVPGVPVRITGLGGGFFLNPKKEYLDLVRAAAGVSDVAAAGVQAPTGSVAVLLYGQAAVVDSLLVQGQVLLTVQNTAIQIDGSLTLLHRGDDLKGDAHLVVGLQDGYAQGTIGVHVNVAGIVTGGGNLSFFVKDAAQWNIMGQADLTLIAFLDAKASLMVGPLGFYVDATVKGGFDVAIVKLENTFDTKVWYLATEKQWGGFVSIGVNASLGGGLASVTGTLKGAVLTAPTPSIFAAADLVASALGMADTVGVWAQFAGGKASAGFGSDPAMSALIAQAQGVADQMSAAKNQAQQAMNSTKGLSGGAVALSTQELVAAYNGIQSWSPTKWFGAWVAIAGQELISAPQSGEGDYQRWYDGVLRPTGLPGDSTAVAQYTNLVSSGLQTIESQRAAVDARIAAFRLTVTPAAPSAAPPTLQDPVTAQLTAPVTSQQRNPATGRVETVVTGGPSFQVDADRAQALAAGAAQMRSAAETQDGQLRDRMVSMEAALAAARAATASTDAGGLPAFAQRYADLGTAAEHQSAAQADLILMRQDWMQARLAELTSKQASVTQWVTAKTAALQAPRSSDNLQTLKALARRRVEALSDFAGDSALLKKFGTDSLAAMQAGPDGAWTFFSAQANARGLDLWYNIAIAGMQASAVAADAAFGQLRSSSDARLQTVRTAHAGLSAALDGLYEAQAAAAGALYDLYSRYYFSRTGQTYVPPAKPVGATSASVAAPTAANLADMAVVRARLDQLARDLVVPRVTGVSVAVTGSDRYTAQLHFSWSATHPSGAYAYAFRDTSGTSQPLGANFLSTGTSNALDGFRFTGDRTKSTTVSRTFQVAARGGAGFAGYGRANYTLTFLAGTSSPVSVMAGTLLTDSTPPAVPTVAFPGHRIVATPSGPAVWTADRDQLAVEWSATDAESGVDEYQYALWSTPKGPSGPGGAAAELRPFVTAHGRTDVTLDQLGLKAGAPVYVAVRAKNPTGLWSATGVSAAIRYDSTPPAFPSGAAIKPGSSLLSSARSGIAVGATLTIPTVAVCPTPLPAPALPAGRAGSWSGSLVAATSQPTPAPAQATFNHPLATDAESGVVEYWYQVGPQPATAYGPTGWTQSVASPDIVIRGAPLNYQDQFYLSVVAVNAAGVASALLVYGPFRGPDPTPPDGLTFCAALASTSDRFAVQISQDATDPETGVTGYQYRVRTATSVVRGWPASGVDWAVASTPGALRTTAALTLSDGQSYYVDVRAVNGQAMTTDVVGSGPILVDNSPPPAPVVTVEYIPPRSTKLAPQVVIKGTAAADPNTGLAGVDVSVGTTRGATDVIAWSPMTGLSGSTISATYPVPPLASGHSYWLQFRSRNGVGLASTVRQVQVSLP